MGGAAAGGGRGGASGRVRGMERRRAGHAFAPASAWGIARRYCRSAGPEALRYGPARFGFPRGVVRRAGPGGLCGVLAPEGCAPCWPQRVVRGGGGATCGGGGSVQPVRPRGSAGRAPRRPWSGPPRSPVLNGELVPARVGLRETGLGWVRGELVPGRVGGRWPRPAFQPVETRGPASRLPTERLVGRRLSTGSSCRHEFGAADRQTGQPSPGQWRSAQINQC